MVYSGASAFIPTAQADKPATMLEKMARAILQASVISTNEEVSRDAWAAAGWQQREHAFNVARAALLATQGPDEVKYVGAACLAEFGMDGSDNLLRASAGNVFNATIDAILSEGEKL